MPGRPAMKVTISLAPSEGKVCLVHTPPHTQPHTESNWPSMENEMSADRTSVDIYCYYVDGEKGCSPGHYVKNMSGNLIKTGL